MWLICEINLFLNVEFSLFVVSSLLCILYILSADYSCNISISFSRIYINKVQTKIYINTNQCPTFVVASRPKTKDAPYYFWEFVHSFNSNSLHGFRGLVVYVRSQYILSFSPPITSWCKPVYFYLSSQVRLNRIDRSRGTIIKLCLSESFIDILLIYSDPSTLTADVALLLVRILCHRSCRTLSGDSGWGWDRDSRCKIL